MLRVIEGGREPLEKGDQVTVDGRGASVLCASFATHVYRGLVSVDYGGGELDLIERERLHKGNSKEGQP